MNLVAAILRIVSAACIAALFATSASALNVVYDKSTPQGHRDWAERSHLREHMEVAAKRICEALYGDEPRSRMHENFTIVLYLAPTKGGNPAFASGRKITWKVGEHPGGGEFSGCPGILVHEMTHILDMGSDRVFTEAMADWVRYYRVCNNPAGVLGLRYRTLRGGRYYGKYAAGANFIDFMTQNYGEGTIYKILKGYGKHHGKVWEELYGKTLDGLVQEWRQMETIYDPVFQWTYNGTAAGVVRHDGKHCGLGALNTEDSADKSGAWVSKQTDGRVPSIKDGCMTIALHGRFPKTGKVAIASLGTPKDGNGKALLLATSSKADTLAAHVIATVPGKGCQIISTTPIKVQDAASAGHSVILTVKGGDAAAVVVDGKPAAKIDMKSKCDGCSFVPVFAVGGMVNGFGVSGFSEPHGKGGLLIDDVRVFNRTYRDRETKQYAETFGPDYQGGVAVSAKWIGGGELTSVDDIGNWLCFNSLGERTFTLPSKDTDVTVSGKKIPSIRQGSKFKCKSFTITGLALVSDNVDLRGVRIVDVEDNARIIVAKGKTIAVNALRGKRMRLSGSLAVAGGMKLAGGLELSAGSVLRLPSDPNMAQVKSIQVKGDGPVTLMPGSKPAYGSYQKLLRIEEMPEDMARFRLNPSDGPDDAVFKPATGNKFLGVTSKKKGK